LCSGLGGINISELARQGLQEKLRETLSDKEKIEIHQRYEQGEISEKVAEVLIGDGLTEIQREKEAFEDAMELDTSGICQGYEWQEMKNAIQLLLTQMR